MIDVSADRADPTAIRVLLSAPPEEGARLGYGLGFNPYCNAVDDADMPLCTFMPRGI